MKNKTTTLFLKFDQKGAYYEAYNTQEINNIITECIRKAIPKLETFEFEWSRDGDNSCKIVCDDKYFAEVIFAFGYYTFPIDITLENIAEQAMDESKEVLERMNTEIN